MIEIKNKQILIDGKPQIIMAGEIHYYRLDREDWQDRIDKLKEAGGNAVATYVPWLCHEPVEGEMDLHGKTRPELDLVGFIDLCHENDLYFFLRPGPFIMAEMKNEGIPHWVYKKHPEIVPVGWDANPATTPTIDYLAPGFLQEVKKYYEAIMTIAAPRLYDNGGNIIGVQLDNEIGMLSWVSNCPDLTDNVIADFANWLQKEYDADTLGERYPFELRDEDVRREAIRSPKEEYAAELMRDLGHYMRNRFARYVAELRAYSEEFGVKDVPFFVNIHGTGGGRGLMYPIGISQLYESYTQAPGYVSGSDIYFGDLEMNTFQDLYLINGFMDAVHNPDQPLTSLEFNCGDGNFGETYGGRMDVSAVDFKLRMCLAQGNRMINYYLFSGGRNYLMEQSFNEGNDRIANTGERHGFAAPIGPEGQYNYTFPRMARVTKTVMSVADKLAIMDEERDNVAFAFIPDYYMTEYRYPHSEKMNAIVRNIEENRAAGSWEIMARAMLLAGYRFGSVDIQNKPLDPSTNPVIAFGSASYMDKDVQQKLADYLNDGGKVLLYGEVPAYDMEGNTCTILSDALGVKPIEVVHGSHGYWPAVYRENWAAPGAELRIGKAQTFEVGETVTPLIKVYGTDAVCGFDAKVGNGRAVVIASQWKCDVPLFKKILEELGSKAGLTHDFEHHGIFMTSTATPDGDRFIHLLNLDGFDKEFNIYDNGEKLFDGRKYTLNNKDGIMLPINVSFNNGVVAYATAEITGIGENSIDFRLTQAKDVIKLNSNREVAPSDDYEVVKEGESTLVISNKHAKVDDQLTVNFR
jgi:beta-galactosidase